MDVLVIGWSDIVRRRVGPALSTLDSVDLIHVASTRAVDDSTALGRRAGRCYSGPDAIVRALAECPGALVYVSGVNTAHADRVSAALAAGHDVIVDKPAFITHQGRDRCLAAARSSGHLLAEAIVWPMHAQVEQLQNLLRDNGLTVSQIDGTFGIPALPPSNFRTDPRRGGGVVADMGVYAMSPGRVFGAGTPATVTGEVTARSTEGLDTAIAMNAKYGGGVTATGLFSLDAEYVNRLRLSGDGWHAVLEPAFSSRADAALEIALTIDGRGTRVAVAPSDPFARFLRDAVARLEAGDRTTLTDRTAESSADLLALASAVALDWDADGDSTS